MKANVEDRGLKDMTPLMEAANAGHLDIVKLLIQHGADVNAQTSQGTQSLSPPSKERLPYFSTIFLSLLYIRHVSLFIFFKKYI